MILLFALACRSDNELITKPYDSIGVVTGDFDAAEDSLGRLDVAFTVYEGYICCAAYNPEIDPTNNALKAEQIWSGADEEGNPEMFLHDALFVNSGTRGFGEFVYNGIDEDDQFVSDPLVIEQVREYVEDRGRLLVVSDWAYDLVEAAWPDRIGFYGDNEGRPDAAQVGSPGLVTGKVASDDIKDALGGDSLAIPLDYTNWALMQSTASDVEVLVTADVTYRADESQAEDIAVKGAPMLVIFEAGKGKVIYSSFSWNTLAAGATDAMLPAMAEGLDPGSATDGSAE